MNDLHERLGNRPGIAIDRDVTNFGGSGHFLYFRVIQKRLPGPAEELIFFIFQVDLGAIDQDHAKVGGMLGIDE